MADEMTKVDVIQYMRPDGRAMETTTYIPLSYQAAHDDMDDAGFRFAAEVLTTGEVSVTIESCDGEPDADIEVVKNGPAVQDAYVAMLKRRLWDGDGDGG